MKETRETLQSKNMSVQIPSKQKFHKFVPVSDEKMTVYELSSDDTGNYFCP